MTGSFAVETVDYPWSCEYYATHGRMMDDDALDRMRDSDGIFLGAIGFPGVPDHVSLWNMLLPLRQAYDLSVNLRPMRLLPGIPGPLRDRTPAEIDMVVVRENTEGEYCGIGGRVRAGTPDEVVTQTAVFTRKGTERIVRFAFELAMHARPDAHLVHQVERAQPLDGLLGRGRGRGRAGLPRGHRPEHARRRAGRA